MNADDRAAPTLRPAGPAVEKPPAPIWLRWACIAGLLMLCGGLAAGWIVWSADQLSDGGVVGSGFVQLVGFLLASITGIAMQWFRAPRLQPPEGAVVLVLVIANLILATLLIKIAGIIVVGMMILSFIYIFWMGGGPRS